MRFNTHVKCMFCGDLILSKHFNFHLKVYHH